MDFNEFSHRYDGLELLPVSRSDYAPGYIFDKVGLAHRHFEPTGDFLIELLPYATEADRTAARTQLRGLPRLPTELAGQDLDLTSQFKGGADLKLANIPQSLTAAIQQHSVESFRFENTTSTTMPPELLPRLRALLDQLRDQDGSQYRRRIAGNFIAMTFFYAGSASIVLDTQSDISGSLEADIKKVDANANLSYTSNGKLSISFKQPDCPFAMDVKKGRQF